MVLSETMQATSSLGNRIVRGYLGLVAATIALSVWAVAHFAALGGAAGELLERNFLSVLAGQGMIEAAERQDSSQILYLGGDIEASSTLLREFDGLFRAALIRARANVTEPGEEDTVTAIERAYETYQDLDAELRKVPAGDIPRFYSTRTRPAFDSLKLACRALVQLNQRAMYAVERRASERARLATLSTSVVAVLVLGFSIAFGGRLSRSIVEPLRSLVEATRRVARGDLELEVPEDAVDELGQLAVEFNRMARRIKDYQALNLERLVRERRKADAIVDSLRDPLLVADQEGKLILLNPAAERLLDVTDRTAHGARLEEVVRDPELREPMQRVLSRARAPDPRSLDEPYLVRRSGRERAYRRRVTPMRTDDGRILGVVLVLQDITHLHEVDRLKSDLVSAVSHEFRTPLTSMGMSVDLLLEGSCGALDERQRDLLSTVREDLQRLSTLVHNLLDLARIEAGRLELEVSELPVGDVLDAAVAPLQAQFEEKGVTLVRELGAEAMTVRADPTKVAWVVSNLVGNALRYTPRGGRITLGAERLGDRVRLRVSDTGPGVPPELREKIFDKFFRVGRDGGAHRPGGVGLGLAIAREMVRAHGGQLWVDEEPGGGARFLCSLPGGGPPPAAEEEENRK